MQKLRSHSQTAGEKHAQIYIRFFFNGLWTTIKCIVSRLKVLLSVVECRWECTFISFHKTQIKSNLCLYVALESVNIYILSKKNIKMENNCMLFHYSCCGCRCAIVCGSGVSFRICRRCRQVFDPEQQTVFDHCAAKMLLLWRKLRRNVGQNASGEGRECAAAFPERTAKRSWARQSGNYRSIISAVKHNKATT